MRRTVTRLALPALLVAAVLLGPGMFPSAQAAEPPRDIPVLLLSAATGLVADVYQGSMTQGRAINEWSYDNVGNQQWRLEQRGDRFRIHSNADGAWCLSRAADGGGAAIQLGGCDGARTDWEVRDLGGDRFRFKDPGGEHFLRTGNETATNGRQLVTGADGLAAQWYLPGLAVPKRPMPGDPRLDQYTFLTAHNAMANTDEGFWGRFPNQSYSLRSQLEQGIRGFQLDVTPYGGGVRMCHGGCWGNERTLTAGLQDIVTFLNRDRNAIVTVFLEDYTSVAELQAAVTAVPGLAGLVFRPDQAGVRSNGWPTVGRLRADNRRLLIFSQRTGREGFGVMHDRDWTVENYWSMGLTGGSQNCYSRWNDIPLSREQSGFVRLHVMNHYRDIPTETAATSDNGGKLVNRLERRCGPVARRKPNYVAVDFFQKSNGPSTWQQLATLNTYW
jgi:chitinase